MVQGTHYKLNRFLKEGHCLPPDALAGPHIHADAPTSLLSGLERNQQQSAAARRGQAENSTSPFLIWLLGMQMRTAHFPWQLRTFAGHVKA